MLFGTPYLLSFQFFVIVFYTCTNFNCWECNSYLSNFQVTLETFTGLVAYSVERMDRKLVRELAFFILCNNIRNFVNHYYVVHACTLLYT